MTVNKTKCTRLISNNLRGLALLPIALLVIISLQSFMEKNPPAKNASEKVENGQAETQDEPVFVMVEIDPEYPGGMEALMTFLKENLVYPEKARKDKTEGIVFASFIIERDGKLSNVKILRGVSPELDAETIRVVSLMPQWKPGRQRGETVRVQYNLPVRFVL